MTFNGRLLENFLDRHPHLSIVNALPQCKGLITRRRIRKDETEESILDFFIVCSKVLPFVSSMLIDEDKKYILTNYKQFAKTGKAIDSDHFTEFMDVDIEVEHTKPERVEIYNFNEDESKAKFKKLTSDTDEFTQCFEDETPLLKQIENWQMLLKRFCSKSFKKIRVKKKNVKPTKEPLKTLIDQRNALLKVLKDPGDDKKIKAITKRISEIEAEENRNQIMKDFKEYSDNPESINVNQMWKRLKRTWPKCGPSLPVAKKNHRGNIITGPRDIKNLLATEYKDRLRMRPTRPDLGSLRLRREKIFQMKLKISKLRKSPDWTTANLDQVLSDLKRNKSRDPQGYVNEIFKHGVIGDNLKKSLLIMMNNLKK